MQGFHGGKHVRLLSVSVSLSLSHFVSLFHTTQHPSPPFSQTALTQAKAITRPCDVWAVGCIAHLMMARRHLCARMSAAELEAVMGGKQTYTAPAGYR